jgi:DNA-binding MarR family transcriptional regulator/GNAT superfamily N-acetyltransferase
MPTSARGSAPRVAAVRAFNRFYTRRIGLLQGGILESPYSLTQVRVLYELAHTSDLSATDLGDLLGLDPGYLSRILRGFEHGGLITRARTSNDRRRSVLGLTAKGRKIFSGLETRQSAEVERMLTPIAERGQVDLVSSMRTIAEVLGDAVPEKKLSLRSHRPGDMGWVMFRHGALYHQEYGWDERFEALVGEIVVSFIRHFDPAREHCWIAELDGERVGSVFLVKHTQKIAKLRLLLVEPSARGHGVGKLLVKECIAFARKAGFLKITLWTNSVLDAARHIYIAEGFELVKEESHSEFGVGLIGQNWELPLKNDKVQGTRSEISEA